MLTKSLKISVVVIAYWCISITMVFLNKYLLSGEDVKLEAPLFITFYQCGVSVALCLLLRLLSRTIPSVITFPSLELDIHLSRQVLPLSVVFVGMMTFNNLCLKYVGTAFYTVGRSLTTVFNVALTFAVLKQTTSFRAIICCLFTILGFVLGVDQEEAAGTLSVIGVIFGVLASLFICLNSILMKRTLTFFDGNVWKLTYYNNVNAVILFIPLILSFGEIYELLEFSHLRSLRFWSVMTISGVCGFAIGFVSGLQIKFTSPLTHNISATAKASAQTALAVLYFQELKTTLWWLSNVFVLGGSAMYAKVRHTEMQGVQTEENKVLVAVKTEDKVSENNGADEV